MTKLKSGSYWGGLFLSVITSLSTATWAEASAQEFFLFTSFRGNGEDGLHLALSTNGYYWEALKGDHSFLKSDMGAGLMRDPCLAHGPDGRFHMVWTCGWTAEKGKVIGYSQSADLLKWSEPKAITVMGERTPGPQYLGARDLLRFEKDLLADLLVHHHSGQISRL